MAPVTNLARRMLWIWPLVAGAVIGVALRLAFAGDPNAILSPMNGAFIWFTPIVVGVTASIVSERIAPRSLGRHFSVSAAANALFVVGTLMLYLEGLICAVLILPLFVMLGGTAGIVSGYILKRTRTSATLSAVIPVPLILSVVFGAVPLPEPIDEVHSSVVIEASASIVWDQIMNASNIRREEVARGWIYRIGVPAPEFGILDQRDSLVRRVRMGKGIYFDQPVIDWEPLEYVTFGYRFYPDSVPARALDDHVTIGGRHFDLLDTKYELTPLSVGSTLLTIRMRYRVSTHFNWYARPLARLLIHDFEKTILAFYRGRSEAV